MRQNVTNERTNERTNEIARRRHRGRKNPTTRVRLVVSSRTFVPSSPSSLRLSKTMRWRFVRDPPASDRDVVDDVVARRETTTTTRATIVATESPREMTRGPTTRTRDEDEEKSNDETTTTKTKRRRKSTKTPSARAEVMALAFERGRGEALEGIELDGWVDASTARGRARWRAATRDAGARETCALGALRRDVVRAEGASVAGCAPAAVLIHRRFVRRLALGWRGRTLVLQHGQPRVHQLLLLLIRRPGAARWFWRVW